jgi:hypothetical protein
VELLGDGKIRKRRSINMCKEKHGTNLSIQNISPEDENKINDVLIYEKWRDDGKNDHIKRDIEKKLLKANAVKKANKHLSEGGNPPFGQ